MLCDVPGTAGVVYTCNVVWWSEKVAWGTHYYILKKAMQPSCMLEATLYPQT